MFKAESEFRLGEDVIDKEMIERWCADLMPGLVAMIDLAFRAVEHAARSKGEDVHMELATTLKCAVQGMPGAANRDLMRYVEDPANLPRELQRLTGAVFILSAASLLAQNQILLGDYAEQFKATLENMLRVH